MARWPLGEEIRYDGTTHPLVSALPYYHLVPKDPAEHLEYRLNIRRMAHNNPSVQRQLIQWSIADPLFFVNTFCWIIEPRGVGKIPFNSWSNQDPWLAALSKYSGVRDIKGDKSRAQGESWLLVADYFREFLLFQSCFQAFVSLDENTADNPDNPDSLGWKVDFLHENLPDWMKVPELWVGGAHRKVSNHTWYNPKRSLHGVQLGGNYLQAFASTGTAGKGGRRKRFGFDEAAFMDRARDLIENLRAVTDCRNVFSTPNGKGDYFAELMHRKDSWLTITLDWRDNPSQNEGLYTTDDAGNLKMLRDNYQYPPDYKWVLDGKIRSYWYDRECERAGNNAVEIARELDRDYGGSKGRPFQPDVLTIARQYVRPESRRGELKYDKADLSNTDELKFRARPEGPLKLWCELDSEGFPPGGDYAVACDIAAGTGGGGTSNSVIQVVSAAGEQVGEFVSNTISPTKLAQMAIALCYWFGRGRSSSFLNWEKTGPLGTQFSREVTRQGYSNVYVAPDKKFKVTKKVKVDKVKRPGWHTQKTSETLEPLVSALENQAVTIHSSALVQECSEYEFGKNGDWVHPGAENKDDTSIAGHNHGDRAVAMGVAVISLQDRKWLKGIVGKPKQQPITDAPWNSSAGRLARYQRESRMASKAMCQW